MFAPSQIAAIHIQLFNSLNQIRRINYSNLWIRALEFVFSGIFSRIPQTIPVINIRGISAEMAINVAVGIAHRRRDMLLVDLDS